MSLVTKPSRRKSTDTAVGLIVHNHPEYLEDKEDVHPSCRPQRTSLIAEKTPTKASVEYVNFADVSSPDLASELPEHTGINYYTIELVDANGSSDHPIHLQVLLSFSTGSRTNPFGCVSIRSLNNFTIAMLTLMARTIKIAITCLMLLDKLEKV